MKPVPPVEKPPHLVLPLARNLAATVRDPSPCGLDDHALGRCGFNDSGEHNLVEQLILGNHAALTLENNFDNPNQTARYDVLGGMKVFSTPQLRAQVRAARADWVLAEADITWLGQVGPIAQAASGLIYISSGRANWFAQEGLLSPFVIWCLATGKPCDIITDLEEYNDYLTAIGDAEKISELVYWLGDYGEKRGLVPGLAAALDPTSAKDTWANAQIAAFLNVRAGQLSEQKKALLPRGFGFNRFVGMAWMRSRFTGFCATVDDNSFMFKEGLNETAAAMEWMFTGTNVSTRVAQIKNQPMVANNWLAIAFSPCTEPVSGRAAAPVMMTGFPALVAGAAPLYTGAQIAENTMESPRIIQQVTVWNASCFATLAPPVNYDPALVTGKEDVEFYRRLQADDTTRNLLFQDNTLHVVKCTSSGKPNALKEKQTLKALAGTVKKLSPCFARTAELGDETTLKVIEARFYKDAAVKKKAGKSWAGELLKRINMALEQLLVP